MIKSTIFPAEFHAHSRKDSNSSEKSLHTNVSANSVTTSSSDGSIASKLSSATATTVTSPEPLKRTSIGHQSTLATHAIPLSPLDHDSNTDRLSKGSRSPNALTAPTFKSRVPPTTRHSTGSFNNQFKRNSASSTSSTDSDKERLNILRDEIARKSASLKHLEQLAQELPRLASSRSSYSRQVSTRNRPVSAYGSFEPWSPTSSPAIANMAVPGPISKDDQSTYSLQKTSDVSPINSPMTNNVGTGPGSYSSVPSTSKNELSEKSLTQTRTPFTQTLSQVSEDGGNGMDSAKSNSTTYYTAESPNLPEPARPRSVSAATYSSLAHEVLGDGKISLNATGLNRSSDGQPHGTHHSSIPAISHPNTTTGMLTSPGNPTSEQELIRNVSLALNPGTLHVPQKLASPTDNTPALISQRTTFPAKAPSPSTTTSTASPSTSRPYIKSSTNEGDLTQRIPENSSIPQPMTVTNIDPSLSSSSYTFSTLLPNSIQTSPSNSSHTSNLSSTFTSSPSSPDPSNPLKVGPDFSSSQFPSMSKAPIMAPSATADSMYLHMSTPSSYETHPSRSNWTTTSHVIESLQCTIDRLKRELQVQQTRCEEEKSGRAALRKRCTQLETQQDDLRHQYDTLNSVLERKERRQKENDNKLKEYKELVESLEKEQSIYVRDKMQRDKDDRRIEGENQRMKIEYTVVVAEMKRKKDTYETLMKKLISVLKDMGIKDQDNQAFEQILKKNDEDYEEFEASLHSSYTKAEEPKSEEGVGKIKRVCSITKMAKKPRPSSHGIETDGITIIDGLQKIRERQITERNYIMSLHAEMQTERLKHVETIAAMERIYKQKLQDMVAEHTKEMQNLLKLAQQDSFDREDALETQLNDVKNLTELVKQGYLKRVLLLKQREDEGNSPDQDVKVEAN